MMEYGSGIILSPGIMGMLDYDYITIRGGIFNHNLKLQLVIINPFFGAR
jgi:hypothetical protein